MLLDHRCGKGPTFYSHDARGRLIGSRKPGDTALLGRDEVIHRAMDEVGNVYRSPDMSDRIYEPGGRIQRANGTSYRQDELGNITQKIETDGSLWQYRWNGAGMLKEKEEIIILSDDKIFERENPFVLGDSYYFDNFGIIVYGKNLSENCEVYVISHEYLGSMKEEILIKERGAEQSGAL